MCEHCHTEHELFHARSQQVLQVLEDWKAQNGSKWIPLWVMHRRMPWRLREFRDVLRALLSQRLVGYQSIRGAGYAEEFYRLECTRAEIREHAQAKPLNGPSAAIHRAARLGQG